MKAIVIKGDQAIVDHSRSLPKLRDDCVLVRPAAIALNPTDWRHIRGGRAKDGCILGCDYAGTVEKVGSAVTKRWKRGDRIFGCAHGANLMNPDDGVFAEYAAVVGDLQMRIPEGMDFEQAATLGLGSITVGQGLYQKGLKLHLPPVNVGDVERKGAHVLIYGGSTATGALGIQFAKQSGYTVITTCSKENFEYVKGLGVDLVVDYKDDSAVAQIHSFTNNILLYAWDTVGVEQSAKFCADSLSNEAGAEPVYATILPVKSPRSDVKTVSTVMYTVFGKDFKFGSVDMPASQEDFEFGKSFFGLVEELLQQGRLIPHHHQLGDGGLDGIVEGLKALEEGKVRASKLVYSVQNTT